MELNFNGNDLRNHYKDRGKLIGYTGEKCENCSRVRVELWENGDKICEKCGWNQKEKVYETDYDI